MRLNRVSYLLVALLLVVASAMSMLPHSAAAQAADIPSGSECQTKPAGLLDVLGMLNDVNGSQASNRVSSIDRSAITMGKPLSSDDTTAVDWTVRQVVACANGLDPLRVMPLLSRNFQTSLVANATNLGELSGVLDQLPFFTTDTIEKGGAPALTVVQSWYDTDTTKRAWAEVSMPVPQENAAATTVSFLVSFVYDEYFWVIDAVWSIN